MSTDALASRAPVSADDMERVLVGGDLAKLTPSMRLNYYRARCEIAGLDWRTQPFLYLNLQGRLVLYAPRTCTDQLAAKHRLGARVLERWTEDDIAYVLGEITGPDGRTTQDVGAVPIVGLKGDQLANARMKAVTKAFRRATLRHCGLSEMADVEADTVGRPIAVDPETHALAPSEEVLRGSLTVEEADAVRRKALTQLTHAFAKRGLTGTRLKLHVATHLIGPIADVKALTTAKVLHLAELLTDLDQTSLEAIVLQAQSEIEEEDVRQARAEAAADSVEQRMNQPERDPRQAALARFHAVAKGTEYAADEARHAVATHVLGKHVSSFRDLSADEIHRVADYVDGRDPHVQTLDLAPPDEEPDEDFVTSDLL